MDRVWSHRLVEPLGYIDISFTRQHIEHTRQMAVSRPLAQPSSKLVEVRKTQFDFRRFLSRSLRYRGNL